LTIFYKHKICLKNNYINYFKTKNCTPNQRVFVIELVIYSQIGYTLQNVLQQHLEATLQDFHQWLVPGLEKVTWCGDMTGDKLSAEAKSHVASELKESLKIGADKRALSSSKFIEIEAILEAEKREEMNEFLHSNEDDWVTFNSQLLQAMYV